MIGRFIGVPPTSTLRRRIMLACCDTQPRFCCAPHLPEIPMTSQGLCHQASNPVDLADETKTAKDWLVDLKAWEATIAQIFDEASHEVTERGKQKIVLAWRKKLKVGPASLQPQQIDEIVHEVRNRLGK